MVPILRLMNCLMTLKSKVPIRLGAPMLHGVPVELLKHSMRLVGTLPVTLWVMETFLSFELKMLTGVDESTLELLHKIVRWHETFEVGCVVSFISPMEIARE